MASASRSRNTHRSQQSTIDHDSRYECTICMRKARDPVVLTCGHFYCWVCIDHWLSRCKRCPLCNYTIDLNKDVIPVFGKGLPEEGPIVRPRPHAPTQRRAQARRQQVESNAGSSSVNGIDTLLKIGLGVLGGALAGAFIYSLFGGSSHQKTQNRNGTNRR